jgi:mono/diheme cytochrome c family protein
MRILKPSAVVLTGLLVLVLLQGAGADEPVPGEEAALVPIDIPDVEKQRKNPVAPTEESVDYGKLIFSSQCTMCHGKAGDGQGDLVERLGLKMPDFTATEPLGARTDGEVFYILTYGHGKMPGQKDRFKDKIKWDLVNYLRTLPSAG